MGDDSIFVSIRTSKVKKTEMRISTEKESLKQVHDPWVEGPVLMGEPIVVDLAKFLEVFLDDEFEGVTLGALNIAPLAESDRHHAPNEGASSKPANPAP